LPHRLIRVHLLDVSDSEQQVRDEVLKLADPPAQSAHLLGLNFVIDVAESFCHQPSCGSISLKRQVWPGIGGGSVADDHRRQLKRVNLN
jgi:hypothetical protein